MNRRRIAGMAGSALVCVLLAAAGHVLSVEKEGTVTDEKGNVIARLICQDRTVRYECKDEYESYVDLACREATGIIAEREEIEESEAFQMIAKGGMSIRTAFRQDVMEGMQKTSMVMASEKAAAVSDTQGHILACYSHSMAEPSRNYVTYPTYAGSTIKPLSVYGPAVEDGTVCWSDLYEDSAYYQITNEEGRMEDWPVNTRPYTYTMRTVQEALKESNNAVTVKILKDYGVDKSRQFLQDTFGLKTEEERLSILEKGEDSVLADIALGYLEAGVTMRDMLGAYQTFANGGRYIPMHAVLSIENDAGSYYQEEQKVSQAFTAQTAAIMNRMLRSVVGEGGTGAAAKIEGLDICGKTGTSDDFKDNWFIGMTPEYVCAVWYEGQGVIEGNAAPSVFREIMENLTHHREVSYPAAEDVVEAAYCLKTGLLANESCQEKLKGYYKRESVPGECDCR